MKKKQNRCKQAVVIPAQYADLMVSQRQGRGGRGAATQFRVGRVRLVIDIRGQPRHE